MNTRLHQFYDQFTKSEKRIADFIISNPEVVINSDIHTLSSKINTSSATLSRFVKKWFNCSYGEFKIELVKENDNSSYGNAVEIFKWADDFKEMPNKIITNIEKVCRDVLSVNNLKTIENVINVLSGAENIYLFGVGSSGIVASDLQQKLIKLGKRTVYLTDSNFGVINATLLTPNDVAVALSFSGKTRDVNFAVRQAKKRGAPVISITSSSSEFLRKNSKYTLFVPSVELNESRLAAIFSRYGQLFIVDMIFVGMAKKLAESPDELIVRYKEILKELKEE